MFVVSKSSGGAAARPSATGAGPRQASRRVSRFVSRISGRARRSGVESRETSAQIPGQGGPRQAWVDTRPTTCKQQVVGSIPTSGSVFTGIPGLPRKGLPPIDPLPVPSPGSSASKGLSWWTLRTIRCKATKLVSASDLADRLAVSVRQVRRLARTPGFPREFRLSERCVRWDLDEVLRRLDGRRAVLLPTAVSPELLGASPTGPRVRAEA